MGRIHDLYKKTYNLSEEKDREYFDCVKDYYYTDEFQSLKSHIQHGSVSLIQHIKSVSYISYRLSKRLGLDFYRTARGALLHDLFYYDWHDPDPSHRLHGYYHPGFALKNARELSRKNNLELTELEENIIYRHMFPLTVIPPKYKEAILVCLVDKYVATKEIIICSSGKRSTKFFSEVEGEK